MYYVMKVTFTLILMSLLLIPRNIDLGVIITKVALTSLIYPKLQKSLWVSPLESLIDRLNTEIAKGSSGRPKRRTTI